MTSKHEVLTGSGAAGAQLAARPLGDRPGAVASKVPWLNQAVMGQLGLGLGRVLIPLLSFALHTASQRASEAIRWTEHTKEALTRLSLVREALAVAEASHRG